ncbi:unnamed protein product [Mesocestoides corti]|nr:unnamed protein product [Mesocestoides corti]
MVGGDGGEAWAEALGSVSAPGHEGVPAQVSNKSALPGALLCLHVFHFPCTHTRRSQRRQRATGLCSPDAPGWSLIQSVHQTPYSVFY